jgi:hypothetical protein
MSIIPTALGQGSRLDQLMMATDVFDTPGTSSWSHPSPGTPLEVQVTLVGGAGGGLSGVGATGASNGGSSSFDNTSVAGGTGATALSNGAHGVGKIDGFYFIMSTSAVASSNIPIIGDGLYGNAGHPTRQGYRYDGIEQHYITGGSGYLKTFRTTVTNDVTVVVGNAGSNGTGGWDDLTASQGGAVIVQYAKAAVGIPAPVQKEFVEEWLDYDSTVGGSGTWIHPRPGQAITMTVILIGGAGGNASSVATGTASKGGTTIFNGETAEGGDPGSSVTFAANPVVNGMGGLFLNSATGQGNSTTGYGRFGAITVGTFDGNTGYTGGTGAVEYRRMTVTGNVNYTIGAGGAGVNGTVGSGNSGGIILKYSK